jgi:hypothetical protein
LADDKDALEVAWRKYRADYLRRQFQSFFSEHKNKPWFKEKYDPDEEPLRKALKAKGREGKVDAFLESLGKGELDDLSFDYNRKRYGEKKRERRDACLTSTL